MLVNVCCLAALILGVSSRREISLRFGRGLAAGTRHSAEVRYTDHWVVEVVGGDEVAEWLADRHGFINLGQVVVPRNEAWKNILESKNNNIN